MGNTRSGVPRGGGGSAAREDAGPASRGPVTARSGANKAVVLPMSPGGPGEPGPRSSVRQRGSTGSGRPSSDMQHKNGAAEEEARRLRGSIASKNSASGSLSRGSDTSAGSPMGAETPTSEHGSNGNAGSSSSKKRKRRNCMSSSRYIKGFRALGGANAAVVLSPDRVGKENTSNGHVANSNVSKVQPRKPTDVPLQNIAAESSLPGKARNRPTAPARQSCLPSLQSVPISLVHHEEMKKTVGDSEPISVQKEDSASGHVKVMPSDQTDGNSNICLACGTPGTLRSCDGKGCQTRYHISCLDPSLEYLSPGIWFCTSCTDKRFRFGLHSIVDGIESVWDAKEAEGMQNSKQYFVKYKNLAHVHNRWVPEGDINVIPGGPDLLSLFNKRNHTEKANWKEEWTKPHRLLRKRLLIPPKLADDFFSSSDIIKNSYCTLEWLVKWRGLGYDHATWELETLPCLCTPEADQLKKNYENRREAAKQSSILTKAKVKQNSFQKLQQLPDGCHPDFDDDHLCSINHLREFWCESRGAVLVDDKEFVIKTVLFTMSVLPDVSQPILIVTTPASLSSWEVQFNKLAPFINVVVYDGGKDKLKLIQDLEFYESGSCIMLQVLLSHADAILEDVEPIARINWEAVIVDYYQKSTLKYLDQLKQLSTDFRMLLLSSPIKNNLPEYVKLLGFLNPGEQENGNCVDNAEALVMVKKTFKDHVAYERQADSSKILEYWLPAYISPLQLEIYCSILHSNSSVLQSKKKNDSSLSDIIMPLSKCCDHPYLVDEFLQNSPVNNHNRTETMDTKVQACGKLLLLQKMLKVIRNKRLRVIILCQSGVAGGNSMGDILEGVVCDRFGPESYERVESGAPLARKHAALNMFNDKTKGRFVFLIGSRACLPSIELSSVDAIIIYNSDRNPINDLESLQRMKIESQFKYPRIFRLYTPFTVEEKQLVLAKHGVLIDNYKDMPHSLGHSLISWGASFLFTRLGKLQHDNYASKSFEGDTYSMDKVILEFLKKLAMNVDDSTEIISKANMSGEFYSRSITLIGENVAMPTLDGDPSIFWPSLLDGKSPCWSNTSKPPQLSHRMLQNIEEPAKVPAEEADEARRKRRKVDGITVPFSNHSSDNCQDVMLPKDCTALSPPLHQLDDTQQKKGVKKRMCTPKNLHIQLKQELSKLIKVLQLPDNVILMSGQLLEYVLNNHQVITKPVDWLHAFIIALCWRAASFLNCKVDIREFLALADKNLNWVCHEDLVAMIYTKLRTLEKKIPNIAGQTSIKGQPVLVEVTQLSWQETSNNLENGHMFGNKEMDLHGKFTNGASHAASTVAEQMISERQEPVRETRRECHMPNDELPNMIVKKSIDLVDNVFSLREKNILCKQQLEISGIETHCQNNVIRLQKVCSSVLEHIRRSLIDEMTRSEKIKLTAQWFAMLMHAFLEHIKLQHDKLMGLQSDTWSSERQLKEKFYQLAKSGQLDRDFDRYIALPESNFVMEEFIHLKEQNDEHRIAESSVSVSDCQQSSNDTLSMEITLVRNEVLSQPTSIQAIENEQVETSVSSGGGPGSEVVDFPENSIRCSSDGIGEQRAGCSSSTIPPNDDSTRQDSSTSECRNTELIEIDNIAKPSMLLGGATCDDILDTDGVHMESPNSASSHSLMASVGTQTVLSCMSPQQATDLSAQQNAGPSWCPPAKAPSQQSLAISRHPPAEAEPSSILGTVGDLQPKVQPSTSLQDEPAEAEDEVEDDPVRMVTAHDLQSEIQPSASVPAEQSTDLPAQQSLATSRHPPAEAKLADIIHRSVEPSLDPHAGVESAGMVTAHGLQSVILPSASVPMEQSTSPAAHQSLATSGHSQAEPADVLGTEAARNLQPEMQPSKSTQTAPSERIVLQSPTLHHGVEPSLDPHARAESTRTLDLLTARDLQSEGQPSASTQDQPAEAEGAVVLGSTAAQDLQPELQPSTAVQQVSLERIRTEESAQIGFQPNMVPGPEQPTEHPPVTTLVLNTPIVSDEPLKNELGRLMQCNNKLSKDHEHKKSQLLMEYNNEIEKIKKKYESLLQKEDSAYLETWREIGHIYRKVYVNQSLAEYFRGVFTPLSAAPGRSTSPAMEQPSGSSSAAQTAASAVISSAAIRPAASHVRPSFVAQPSWASQQQAILHGSYGSAGAQPRPVQSLSALASTLYTGVSPVPAPHLPHVSYRSAGAQLRASAPHLQQRRMPSQQYAVRSHQQQQLPASAGAASLVQYAPVFMGNYASSIPQGGGIPNSMDPSSAQQTMLPSASSSRPPRRASSMPPGRHQEAMANFLQSSGPNPIFMPAHQQSSYPSMVLGSTSSVPGPQNAVPGIQQHGGGAQLGGVDHNRSGYEPPSLGVHMPARFGLGSSSSGPAAGRYCM